MPSFTQCPVIDNHAHVLEPEKATIEPIWLAREFFHGIADTPIPGVAKSKLWGATDELLRHFPHMGVVLTAVCQLSRSCSAARPRWRRSPPNGTAGRRRPDWPATRRCCTRTPGSSAR